MSHEPLGTGLPGEADGPHLDSSNANYHPGNFGKFDARPQFIGVSCDDLILDGSTLQCDYTNINRNLFGRTAKFELELSGEFVYLQPDSVEVSIDVGAGFVPIIGSNIYGGILLNSHEFVLASSDKLSVSFYAAAGPEVPAGEYDYKIILKVEDDIVSELSGTITH
jgi:hypothetical protein